MRRVLPLSLALALALVVGLTSLFFGIKGVESQTPRPNDKEQVLLLNAVPSGVTPKYVAPGGQTTVVDCGGDDAAWSCSLPVGMFHVEPLSELFWVWEVVEAQSSEPVWVGGIVPFVGWFVQSSGAVLPSICITSKIATASDAWDFKCVLGNSGKFIADFDPKGFVPNVVDPIPPEPPSLLPTVTPSP